MQHRKDYFSVRAPAGEPVLSYEAQGVSYFACATVSNVAAGSLAMLRRSQDLAGSRVKKW